MDMPDFWCQGLRQTRTLMMIPFRKDEDFVGKEDIIKMIGERFLNFRSVRRVALLGLGGVGYVSVDPEDSKII